MAVLDSVDNDSVHQFHIVHIVKDLTTLYLLRHLLNRYHHSVVQVPYGRPR